MSEKVLLVAIEQKRTDLWPVEETLRELEELVSSSDGEVVDRVVCHLKEPTAATLIGKGKVDEIAQRRSACGAQTVIVGCELKGNQQRNLEEAFGAKTIDRTQLILDIFARRAQSPEGKMQVELAQLQYMLPRLVGHGAEMSRMGGGIGTLGPGETKLETDRRRIAERISRLRKDLQKVSGERQLKRKKRREKQLPSVSLVGYTNAGKSTLMNALTSADRMTKDTLFTTLDPLSRQLTLENEQKIVLSDTVGFMRELPHHLIEAFKATLEEVQEADLLLHVLDVSHPHFQNLKEAVEVVLRQLGAQEKPILVVLNKMDRLADEKQLDALEKKLEPAVAISALTGKNLDRLQEEIARLLFPQMEEIDLKIPFERMDLVNLLHKEGRIKRADYSPQHVHVVAVVPGSLAQAIKKALKG